MRDAATYITALPKREHDTDEWQIAMQTLLLVAERDGPGTDGADRDDAGAEPAPRESDTNAPTEAREDLPGHPVIKPAL